MLEIDILSLFPEYFKGPFEVSMIKKAIEKKLVSISQVNIRDFSADKKHHRVDDRPFGGGPGMLLMAQPVRDAILSVKREESYVVHLSPQGKKLTYKSCKDFTKKNHLVLLCGHYEGVDERVLRKYVDEEISIGDYILTNGCAAAIVFVDAILRFIPNFLGHPDAVEEDTFQENGLFKGPQYTRPLDFEGMKVPDILLEGHHANIQEWRFEKGLEKTKMIRPDLYQNYLEQKKKKGETECKAS